MFPLTLIYITCYKTTYVTGMRNRTFVPITTHFTDMCIPHFFLASERRSTVDVRRRPGYKMWRLFKFEYSEVNINQYK
jgi:hypothetical protein